MRVRRHQALWAKDSQNLAEEIGRFPLSCSRTKRRDDVQLRLRTGGRAREQPLPPGRANNAPIWYEVGPCSGLLVAADRGSAVDTRPHVVVPRCTTGEIAIMHTYSTWRIEQTK